MELDLLGKKAIVNGGARGIGRETVLQFVREGCDVYFGSRSQESIDATISAAPGPGRATGGVADMRDAAAYGTWLRAGVEALGGCDVFVHTASASAVSTADWALGLDLDIMGAVTACDLLREPLAASGMGSVVLLSSTAAVETFFKPCAFNALKAALITYGKQLSQAWGPDGIRVNMVTPGPVEFENGNWAKIRENASQVYDDVRADIPLGRYGTPADVAAAILFLASPVSGYITGTNIIVDGGYTKRVQF